jgi:uncharacterized protein YpmB
MEFRKLKTDVNIDLLHEELAHIKQDDYFEGRPLSLYSIVEEEDEYVITSEDDISQIIAAHNKQGVSKAETNRQIRNQRLGSAKAKLRAIGLTDEEIDEIRNS